MNSISWPDQVQAGQWTARRAAGELAGPDGVQRLEPKVMDLLCLLAAKPGQVWSRDQLMSALWPGLVVGEDSLARTVSKLRHALGDDARTPRYVETIAKRGYRWMAEPGTQALNGQAPVAGEPAERTPRRGPLLIPAFALAVVAAVLVLGYSTRQSAVPAATPASGTDQLLVRAEDYYFQFSRADNEAALELYQRVLGLDPDRPEAMAGLANALAQRAIRWPDAPGADAAEFTRLGDALANGHLAREPARSQLQRARQLAQAAVARAPDSAGAYKALGLVVSAQGYLQDGLVAHRRAVELDPDAWGAMINIGDLLELTGRADEALPWFERAYAVMARTYDGNPVQVRGWHDALGVLIASRHRTRGDLSQAEAGYRRVLTLSPLHPEATSGLATVLSVGGDHAAAERLCRQLRQRVGAGAECGEH